MCYFNPALFLITVTFRCVLLFVVLKVPWTGIVVIADITESCHYEVLIEFPVIN